MLSRVPKSTYLRHTFKPLNFSTTQRGFHSTLRQWQASYPIQKDPSHPSLFYHLREAPNALSPTRPVFALSFSDKPLNEEHPLSRSIVGWIPAEDQASSEQESGINDFKQNS